MKVLLIILLIGLTGICGTPEFEDTVKTVSFIIRDDLTDNPDINYHIFLHYRDVENKIKIVGSEIDLFFKKIKIIESELRIVDSGFLSERREKESKRLEKEKVSLNALVNVITSVNQQEAIRVEAIKQIKQEFKFNKDVFPEVTGQDTALPFINKFDESNENFIKLLKNYNAKTEKRMLLIIGKEELVEKLKKVKNELLNIVKTEREINAKYIEEFSNLTATNEKLSIREKAIALRDKDQTLLNNLDRYNAEYQKALDNQAQWEQDNNRLLRDIILNAKKKGL